MSFTRWMLIGLSLVIGCGDDDGPVERDGGRIDLGPPPADTGPSPGDTGPSAGDTGPTPSDTGIPDVMTVPDGSSADAAPACGGETCGAAEECCVLDCDGTMGCAETCPDLACAECGGMISGTCTGGLGCQCCPAGGPTQNCVCSTTCTTDAECTDPARPDCNTPTFGGPGFCAARDFRCCWECNCAAPDTPIATPSGERPIAELVPGDLVYSVDADGVVVVPLVRVQRVPVAAGHRMVRLTLSTGRVLELSSGHPMADGRLVSDLREGERFDGVAITAHVSVEYAREHTFDILPSSSSGAYFAAGVLVGSTMR